MNLSTRPALSSSFCFPVKKGWHCPQISVDGFSLVERVWYTWPQEPQVIVVALYSGWMPVFITILLRCRWNTNRRALKSANSALYLNNTAEGKRVPPGFSIRIKWVYTLL
jgi:hypothetical protein